MKMPNECPFCKGPLQNEWEAIWDILHKKCTKRIDHNIEFIAPNKPGNHDDEVENIKIMINGHDYFLWTISKQKIELIKRAKVTAFMTIMLTLPFFMPDFTSFSKLMDKLKTYLVFS